MRTMVVDLNVSDKAARHASRKAAKRLIPFLILCFLVAYVDRVNVGFAALTMNKELGLTAEMFGFGVGIFFFGFFIIRRAIQLDFGKGRRAAMDCQDHDLLGPDFGIIRFRTGNFGDTPKPGFLILR